MNQLNTTSLSLPQHWRWERLEDLGQWGSGGTPRRSVDDYFGGDIPWLKIGDLTDGIVDTSEEYLTERGLEESAAKMIPAGSLLIGMYGSIGKLGIPQIPCATNQAIAHCLPNDSAVITKYLFWALFFYRSELTNLGKGGTQQNISQTVLKDFRIPVPPVEEQRRIVSKIDELFSNLDAGLESLEIGKRKLERYRLSVLQAAVEGRLTAEWRRTHNPEPADQLLERILEQRRKQWEERYRWERYESRGKEPPSGWRDRYNKPDVPDLDDCPKLPERWCWTGLNALYEWSNGNGLPKKERKNGPYPVYGGNGVTGSHSDYMTEESTVVIGRVGANCGNVHIAPANSWITDNAIYSAWKTDLIDHDFMRLQLRARRLGRLAAGSGQPYLSQTKLNSIPVVLPPYAEQKAIIEETERVVSVAEDSESTVERESRRSSRLRQSILKQAFSGRLL